MKTVNHSAMTQLFEKAETLSQEPHESWKCIYFKFSNKPERNNRTLYSNFVVKPIIELLAAYEGTIYLCDDGDIMILFQGTLKPVVQKLSSHFGDLDPEQLRGQVSNSLFSIFDLSKHWEGFYSLCEAKYLDALVHAEEARMNFVPYGRIAVTPRP